MAVKQEEMEELLYKPQSEEWVGRDPDLECDRISHGLSQIMSLAIAEPFLVPVDLNVYPMYALIIDYPMDLTTIKVRKDHCSVSSFSFWKMRAFSTHQVNYYHKRRIRI